MLSITNEVDPLIFCCVCFVCYTNMFFSNTRNVAQARSRKSKGSTWMGTLILALKKRLREWEREDHSRGARPPNLLNIALCGLASLPFLLIPRSSHPCSKRPHIKHVNVKIKETRQRTSKETNGKKKHVNHTKKQRNMLSNKRGVS